MLRRGLALGGGLVVLILLVLGVKGCLDARADRALSDYARNVTQIVDETQQTSKAFFGKLEDPGNLSVTEFVAEVNADRSAMDNYATRIDGLSAPGDMGHAQSALELVYELRASAMDEIADKMSTALGDAGSAQATDVDRQRRCRSCWPATSSTNRSCGRRSTASSPTTGSRAATCRRASSCPTGPSGSTQATVSRGAGRGQRRDRRRRPRASTGSAWSASASTGPNWPKATTAVAAEETPEVEVQVENQGESTENGVSVSVSVNGGRHARRDDQQRSAPAKSRR